MAKRTRWQPAPTPGPRPKGEDLEAASRFLARYDPDYSPRAQREKPHRRAARIALDRLGR